MPRQVNDLAIPSPGVSRDTAAQLERLLSNFLLTGQPGSDAARSEPDAPVPLVSSQSAKTISCLAYPFENPHQTRQSNYLHLNLDFSYSILVKTVNILKEIKSSDQRADAAGRLRKALLTLAIRLREYEKDNLGLRERLARAEDACQGWKNRATKAEFQLEILTTAISRLE